MSVLHLLSLILITSMLSASAAPLWRFSNPKPHGNNILDFGLDSSGNYWEIGDRGRVYTSPDLDTWFPKETGTTRSLRSLIFFKGNAVISTEAGGILTGPSADALSFVDLGTSDWLEGLAASANTVVAVGDNGSIYSSSDAHTWTARGGKVPNWLRSVAYGASQFLAVGEDGTILTSADGITWSQRTSGTTAHLNKVQFINDRFWIVGDRGVVLTNNFRMTFFPVNVGVTNTLYAVTGSTNEIVIAGDSMVLLGNLQTGAWSQQADAASLTLAPLWPYYSAFWDGRLFMLGGRTGMEVEGFRTNSTAPLVWYNDPQPTRNWLWSATRATNLYAACGAAGTIVTSEDGIRWNQEVTPATAASQVLLGIGGNNKALIAVGTGGIILRGPNVVTNTVSTNSTGQLVTNQTSLFGLIWQQSSSPTANDLQAVAANDATFVLGGGQGTILTSADGVSWQARASGVTNFFSSATSWPQGWVMTGSGGAIFTSTDATQWTKRSSGTTAWVYSVRYVGGKLIAVGENGVILTSDNGTNWTPRNSGTTEWLNDVTFAQNTWWIAGSSGLILSSTDSINWTISNAITSKSLYSAVTDGQQLIMSGLEGVIIHTQLVPVTSPVNFTSLATAPQGTLFLFDGVVDQRFELEETPSLNPATWIPAASLEITDPGGTLIYELPADSSQSRFFRTRLLLP